MAIFISILTSFGQAALKIFLSGLFNTVLQKLQDDADHQTAAANMTAQTTVQASHVEVQIAQQQAQVAIQAAQPKPPSDPFGVDAWNKG